MTLPAVEQIEHLSRDEPITLVTELVTLVLQQQAEIAQLKAEVEELRQPPATSRNSSQPPARDQKGNLPPRKKKKFGPPFGHARQTRPLRAHPDRIICAPVTQCRKCQADLQEVEPQRIVRRQVTELPVITPLVIETREHEVICPFCQHVNRGGLPAGLEAERQFGPRLEATVVYLKHEQHLSYERLSQALREVCGVELSEGGASAIIERAGQLAAAPAAAIRGAVTRSQIIQSDETSARVSGANWWQWVFRSAAGVYHTIAPTRSAAVIAEIMGESRAEVWVSDCFSARLRAPAEEFQLCLAHQLRALQRVLDADPQCAWAAAMEQLFRTAIHLQRRFDKAEPELTLSGYLRRAMQIEAQLDDLLARRVRNGAAQQLRERFLRHREKLLAFLHYPGVPPTNNASEQALRGSVIHRKVTNGFRSAWGARAYAALQSVIATARHKGAPIFETLVNLMGSPVLHYLGPSDP